MSLELLKDEPRTTTFYPTSIDSRPSSATLDFKSPGGASKATPGVTVSTVSATVSSATSQTTFNVSSTTGLVVGGFVWLETDDGWRGAVQIAEIDGSTVTLTAAPPGTLDTASTLEGLGLTATIPASAVDTVDRFYRLEWTITCDDGTVTLQHQIAHVVRMQFSDPVSDAEAKRYVAANWPGLAASKDAGFFRGVTDRANARVRNLIQASGDFPHMIGDPALFSASGAGLAALRLELAHLSLVPGDFDPAEYIATTEKDLRRSIREAQANAFVDRNEDGIVAPDDVRGYYTIRAVRQ